MGSKQERRKFKETLILKPVKESTSVPPYLRRIKGPEEMKTQAMSSLTDLVGMKILHLDELNEHGIKLMDSIIEGKFMELVDAGGRNEAVGFMSAYFVRGDRLTDEARAWKEGREAIFRENRKNS